MQTWFLRFAATAVLVLASTTVIVAQKPEFSADMQLLDATARTETVKLHVGNQRARLDRTGTPGDTNGISALIIDFYHQILYLPCSASQGLYADCRVRRYSLLSDRMDVQAGHSGPAVRSMDRRGRSVQNHVEVPTGGRRKCGRKNCGEVGS